MKTYTVSMLTGAQKIDLESLPVAKITHYPQEKRDYKPYAQVSLGFDDTGLSLRMTSFEVSPLKESTMKVILYPYPKAPTTYLEVTATPQEVTAQLMGENGFTTLETTVHTHNGVDLQGVSWGYDVMVPQKELAQRDTLATVVDNIIRGNFYKLQEITPEHYGSFGEVKFSLETIAEQASVVPLQLVSY